MSRRMIKVSQCISRRRDEFGVFLIFGSALWKRRPRDLDLIYIYESIKLSPTKVGDRLLELKEKLSLTAQLPVEILALSEEEVGFIRQFRRPRFRRIDPIIGKTRYRSRRCSGRRSNNRAQAAGDFSPVSHTRR